MIKKTIPFGDLRYSVSNTGLIINTRTNRVLKLNDIGGGYLQVTLFSPSERKGFLVHLLVARAFKKNHKNLPQVNHKDRDTGNNNSRNLEWVTASQNIKHSYERKRGCGSYPGRLHKKLDDTQVLTIKKLEGEVPVIQIAKEFKVSRSTIQGIFNGRTRKYLSL